MILLHALYVAAAVVFLFSVTIFVHELGHFLAARKLGMVVDVFSIGFGPALWKRKVNGITYKIGIIPVGGYVALPQLDPELGLPDKSGRRSDEKSEERSMPSVPAWKKIIAILAGAAGNIVLAVILAWVVYWMGKPSTPAERSARIGFVIADSEAYKAGIRPGDEILSVNDVPVGNWQELMEQSMHHDRLILKTHTTDDKIVESELSTEKGLIGIKTVSGIIPVGLCRVKAPIPGYSAEAAGIKPGDTIKIFNGFEVFSIPHLTELVTDASDMTVPVVVDRFGELLLLDVTPSYDQTYDQVLIGITFDRDAVDYDRVVHIPPGEQIKRHATAIFRVLRMLVTPKTSRTTAMGLGGPVMIIYFFQDVVRQGVAIALWFTCFINVNLAILNLLPIPVLDGGHIMFCMWEVITGRKVNAKVFQWTSQFFAALLILAVVLLTFKDAKVLWRIHGFFGPEEEAESVEENSITNSPAGE